MNQANEDQWLKVLKSEVEGINDKVSEDSLDAILAGLAARRKRRRVRKAVLVSTLSAAAVIAAFALIPSARQASETGYFAEAENSCPADIAATDSTPVETEALMSEATGKMARVMVPEREEAVIADETKTTEAVPVEDSASSPDNPAPDTPSTAKRSGTPAPTVAEIVETNRYLASLSDDKPRRKKLNLSFSGNSALTGNVTGPQVTRTYSVIVTPGGGDDMRDGAVFGGNTNPAEESVAGEKLIEVKTNYVFAAPVSAALALSYDLTDRLAIESGLSYTTLQSTLAMKAAPIAYSQHFIGIPLSASYKIVQGKKSSIYLKAGAMAEKCIADDSAGSDTGKGDFFISASAAAGVNYKLTDWLGIFAEPYLSYHFDTPGISSTIYGTAPLQPGLQAGLRLSL